MKNWIEQIVLWDIKLEQHINIIWANSFLDWLMPLLRHPLNWAPFYLVFIWYMARRFNKAGWLLVVLLFALIIFTDTVSAQLIKPWINRLRPCWNATTVATIRMLTDCGGRYSFPSNHAANHFAIATFVFICVRKMAGQNWWWLYIWAAAICYAQVYVGKHFPLDVLGGAFFGTLTAITTYLMCRKLLFGSSVQARKVLRPGKWQPFQYKRTDWA